MIKSCFMRFNLAMMLVILASSFSSFSREVQSGEKIKYGIKPGEVEYFNVKLNKDDLVYFDLHGAQDFLYLQLFDNKDNLINNSTYYYAPDKSISFKPKEDGVYKIKVSNLSNELSSNFEMDFKIISSASDYKIYISNFESWLKFNLIPVSSAGWQSLLKSEEASKIIAFGEPTHGGAEFWQQRLDLAKALAGTGQLHAIALEQQVSEIIAMNDYVHKDSMFDVRPRLEWNGESINNFFDGIRAYNMKASENHKIDLIGIDFYPDNPDLPLVKQFSDPLNMTLEFESIFSNQWVFIAQNVKRNDKNELNIPIAAGKKLLADMSVHKDEWQKKTSEKLYQQAWLLLNARIGLLESSLQKDTHSSSAVRDQLMASQVEWLANHMPENKKILLYAHNFHVAKSELNGFSGKTMGWHLKKSFGNKYKVIAGDFNKGKVSVYSREKWFNRTNILDFEAAPPESLESYLSTGGVSKYILPLNNLSIDAEKVLNRKIQMRNVNLYGSEKFKNELFMSIAPLEIFDYLFFVNNQTAV